MRTPNPIMKKAVLMLLVVLTCGMLLPANLSAVSIRKRALKAYKQLLTQAEIGEEKYGYGIPSSEFKFSIIYLDNNTVPELIIWHPDNGWGAPGDAVLYTFKGSTLVDYGLSRGKSFRYYKKKGVAVSEWFDDTGKTGYTYLWANKGSIKNIKKAKFKKLRGKAKKIKPVFKYNTPANRAKYLK